MKKTKMTVYLDDETRKKLDEIYAWAIQVGNKKSYSYFIAEGIKVWHECVLERKGCENV